MLSLHTAPDMLSLLYEQHRNYTAELGRTHQKLSKLYKKISKVERVLAERQERQLTRDQRKKWQYSRVLTKGTIQDMESQQANLHDALRQCTDLIASMEYNAYNSPMVTPWSTQFAPSPCACSPLTPFSPVFTPYAAHRPASQTRPQYWDLSGLPERSSSPHESRSAADSGYHEPQILGLVTEGQSLNDDQHLQTQEMMAAFAFNFESQGATEGSNNSETSVSEQDTVSDLPEAASPLTASLGASESSSSRLHKRCVSANAAQLNLGDLASPFTTTKRGVSVGPVPDRKSDVSGNGLDGRPMKEK